MWGKIIDWRHNIGAVSLNIFIHYKAVASRRRSKEKLLVEISFSFRLFPSSPSSTLIEHSGEFDVLANTAMMFVDLSISRQNISPKIQLFVENSHAIKINSSSVLAANKLPLSGGEEKWRKRTDRHGLNEFSELGHTSVSARVDDWSRKTRFYFPHRKISSNKVAIKSVYKFVFEPSH